MTVTKVDLLDEIKPTADKVRLIEIHCELALDLLWAVLAFQLVLFANLSVVIYFVAM